MIYQNLKNEICKKALNRIKEIYKESKIKIVGIEDIILNRAFINEAKSIYFIEKFTYLYDINYIKENVRVSNIEYNMLKDYNNQLYLQKVKLKIVKSKNELFDNA